MVPSADQFLLTFPLRAEHSWKGRVLPAEDWRTCVESDTVPTMTRHALLHMVLQQPIHDAKVHPDVQQRTNYGYSFGSQSSRRASSGH